MAECGKNGRFDPAVDGIGVEQPPSGTGDHDVMGARPFEPESSGPLQPQIRFAGPREEVIDELATKRLFETNRATLLPHVTGRKRLIGVVSRKPGSRTFMAATIYRGMS